MPLPRTVEAFAPAKINLTLHVTGRRADGYHLLDSLVVFAGVGDVLRVRPGDRLSLTVGGPRAAGVPADDGNLVLKAARVFDQTAKVSLHLDKHLPAAAGIGGGSSDAAACLRALAALTGQAVPDAGAVLPLGADVPVCLKARPLRMTSIGEVLADIPPLPPLWLLLVNPGVAVPTPSVFKGLAHKENAPMPAIPTFSDAQSAIVWMAAQRNDLEPLARALAPVIGEVLQVIAAAEGCGLARMSGSGATCFGLFAAQGAAEAAARRLAAKQPGWWCAAAPVLQQAPAVS